MIWYVDPKSGSDNSNGQSLEKAFKTLSHAINQAKAGDEILLVPGAYDQDLPKLVSAARTANVSIGVVGGH